MSRLKYLFDWIMNPEHQGATLFFTNTNDTVIGTNTANDAVYLKKDATGWGIAAAISKTHLIQTMESLCPSSVHSTNLSVIPRTKAKQHTL